MKTEILNFKIEKKQLNESREHLEFIKSRTRKEYSEILLMALRKLRKTYKEPEITY